MHLKFNRQSEDNPFIESTEVLFSDHEEKLKQNLVKVLPNSGLEYDTIVFPEKIILNGLHSNRRIHQLILSDKSLMKPFGHLARMMPGEIIHEIKVSDKYL